VAVDDLFSTAAPDDEASASVWAALESDPPATDADTEAVVPKADYCESCPFLADPPTVRCTRPGTEIVDFPDRQHVRVRGCPFAADDRPPTRSPRRPSTEE
jgi:hypothetical protein